MEMFLETGKDLVWCCFCPFTHTQTNTHTLFPRKMVWLPSIIKRCVLCGACCLCKKSPSVRDHLTSFDAILIFSLFFTIAPGQMLVGVPILHLSPPEGCPRGAAAQGQSGCVWPCQESCRAELALAVLGTEGVTRVLSHSPVTHCVSCLQAGGSRRDTQPS